MVMSRQHRLWISRGSPDYGLALPLQLLGNTLSAAGYIVYTWPNEEHQDAQPPEDHTQYSETNWPGGQEYGYRHAIDVMPPRAGSGLPSLTALGQTLFNARQAGQITWLKYMNWPSDGNPNRAVQDRWEPNHARGSSSDTGHMHLSCTTGVLRLQDGFNPLLAMEVSNLAHSIDEVYAKVSALYDTTVALANGNQPTGGGNSAIPDWVKTMQSYGPRLDAISSQLATALHDLDALTAKVDALGAGSAGTPGDVAVTGTLHLGAAS